MLACAIGDSSHCLCLLSAGHGYASPPMTADEKTIATRSKIAKSPVDDRFVDFGVVG
jgi:hypothetical protein